LFTEFLRQYDTTEFIYDSINVFSINKDNCSENLTQELCNLDLGLTQQLQPSINKVVLSEWNLRHNLKFRVSYVTLEDHLYQKEYWEPPTWTT
jgi:hypothetical protein